MTKHILFTVAVLWGSFIATVSHSKEAMTLNSVQLVESVLFVSSHDASKDPSHDSENTIVKGDHPKIHSKKDISLVGRHKVVNLSPHKKIVQVVWTGLQDGKKRHAGFDKPLTTVVQTGSQGFAKNTQLPVVGDTSQIDRALEKLQGGDVNAKDAVEAHNPESDERHVQGKTSGGYVGDEGMGGDDSDISEGDNKENHPSNKGSLEAEQGLKSTPKSKQNQTARSSRHHGRGYNGNGLSNPLSGGLKTSPPPSFSAGGFKDYTPPNLSKPSDEKTDESEEGFAKNTNDNSDTDQSSKPEPAPKEDERTVEVVDCDPRVDEMQNRVFLQNKVIYKTNGKITEESQCKDSFTFFDIRRDYHAEGCEDYVNYKEKKAFDRFRKYWVDPQGDRHYLGEKIYTDYETPRPFLDEKGPCAPLVDRESNTATAQVETVYYGRGNTRMVVEGCHKTDLVVPIHMKACSPTHDTEAGLSRQRIRGEYIMEDSVHEAFPCEFVGEAIPHKFDPVGCKPVKDYKTKILISIGKRYIDLPDLSSSQDSPSTSKMYISGICEPYGDKQSLRFERRDCHGYDHDFEGGKSYLKGKWVYEQSGTVHDVSKCMAGEVSFPHGYEPNGYDHDDQKKQSRVKNDVFIKLANQNKVFIERDSIQKGFVTKPYTFVKEQEESSLTRQPYVEGCYKYYPQDRFKLYTRCDGSSYKEFMAKGSTRKGENVCTTSLISESESGFMIYLSNNRGKHISYYISDADFPRYDHSYSGRLYDFSDRALSREGCTPQEMVGVKGIQQYKILQKPDGSQTKEKVGEFQIMTREGRYVRNEEKRCLEPYRYETDPDSSGGGGLKGGPR